MRTVDAQADLNLRWVQVILLVLSCGSLIIKHHTHSFHLISISPSLIGNDDKPVRIYLILPFPLLVLP